MPVFSRSQVEGAGGRLSFNIRQPPGSGAGACAGICLIWLSLPALRGSDGFLRRSRNRERQQEMIATHQTVESLHRDIFRIAPDNRQGYLLSYQRIYGEITREMSLAVDAGRADWYLISAQELVRAMTATVGGGIVNFVTEGGARLDHAVAVHWDGQSITFFDPNGGEVVFDDLRAFTTWLGRFLAEPFEEVGAGLGQAVFFTFIPINPAAPAPAGPPPGLMAPPPGMMMPPPGAMVASPSGPSSGAWGPDPVTTTQAPPSPPTLQQGPVPDSWEDWDET